MLSSAAVEVAMLMQVGEVWRNYSRKVETDPVPTKALTSLFGFMLGDFLAQRMEGRPFNPLRCVTAFQLPTRCKDMLSALTCALKSCHIPYVLKNSDILYILSPGALSEFLSKHLCLRCLRLGSYGLTVDGPIGHMWYKLLDKYVYPNDPQCNAAVLLKTAADQLLWAPVMTCVYFAFLRTVEGHPELITSTIQVCCKDIISMTLPTVTICLAWH